MAALTASLIFISFFSSPFGSLEEINNTTVTFVNKVETFVMQYMVSPPLLGTQSQAWWGAGVTFLGRLYSGHLHF